MAIIPLEQLPDEQAQGSSNIIPIDQLPDGASQAQDPTLPNAQATEQKIGNRQDLLSSLVSQVKSDPLSAFMPAPPQNILHALEAIGGTAQRAESAIANPLLSLQKGDTSGLIQKAISGATGERQGQLGDLVRTTGVGGPYNEALASTAGFLALMGTDIFGNEGKVTKGIKDEAAALPKQLPEIIDPIKQAVKDAVVNKTGFLDDVRSAFYNSKSDLGDKFGEGLDMLAKNNPDKKVNLRPAIDQLNAEIAFDPKIRNAVNKCESVLTLLDNPKLSNEVPLKEAQNIVNEIQSKIASRKLQGMGVRPDDIPLLDTVFNFKDQMVQAFPEIHELRSVYRKGMDDFRLLSNKFKPGNLMGNIEKKFGDVEVKAAADRVLKNYPDIVGRIKGYNALRKTGTAVAYGVEGLTGLSLLRKVLGH